MFGVVSYRGGLAKICPPPPPVLHLEIGIRVPLARGSTSIQGKLAMHDWVVNDWTASLNPHVGKGQGGRSNGPYTDPLPLSCHFRGGGGSGGSGG